MKITLTYEQAADLMTAASIRDMLNGRGGIPLTDSIRDQYHEQLDKVEANIPSDLARVAWTEAAARDPEASLSTELFTWLRDQNITD